MEFAIGLLIGLIIGKIIYKVTTDPDLEREALELQIDERDHQIRELEQRLWQKMT